MFGMKDRVSCVEFGDAETAIVASLVGGAGLCAIGGGAISSISESSLINICSILLCSKTLLLALGISALDGLSSGLRAHNGVKKKF